MILHKFLLACVGLLSAVRAMPNNCQPNTWQNLTSLPSPRQEHSTVALNDSAIAVVGGTVPATSGIYWNTTDLLQIYDLNIGTWQTMSPMPTRMNHPNVAVANNKLYLLGGLVDGSPLNDSINWVASGLCYMYDPISDAWTPLENMPPGTERGSAVTGLYNEMIYLAGGMTILQNTYQDAVSTVTAFNTSSGSWQRLPAAAANIPSPRQHATGGVVGNVLYVLGGRWLGQTYVRGEVFELDLTNQMSGWQTSAQRMPVPRGGLCGGPVGNNFYTFGGEGDPNTSDGVFNNTETFDISTQLWTELPSMAVPRHGTHAAVIGNQIFIPGGGLQQDGKSVLVDGTVAYGHSTAHFDAFCA